MRRAWSGCGTPIKRVEFDGGDGWQKAQVTPGDSVYAWSHWSATWLARPGSHVLRCRAFDASGAAQPLEPQWDLAGFANNQVQEVPVFVPDEATALDY